MDLTEAFAPGAPGEDLAKTDFFDFVVSPPPHCTSGGGGVGVITDDESFLHRTCGRGMNFLGQDPRHEDHDSRDMHTSSSGSFIKETNNNTLTALPPVSTITGSLSHHSAVRGHGCAVTGTNQVPMDQSDCDYWGGDDGKEQTCNILLEDLNKYCWSTHTNSQSHGDAGNVHGGDALHRTGGGGGGCPGSDRHQNTDGAIYTLTVLNNEANSMDALDCCKSPAAPSNDSWSLRPNLDLDAILSMEPSPADQDHDVQNTVGDVARSERFHVIPTPSSQYTTDDSGFVESKELCGRGSSNPQGDNNNDWKLSDQNHLQDAVAAAAAASDSAESLLRSALQGKLYSGPTQIASPSSSQSSTMSLSVTNSTTGSMQMMTDHQQSQQQQQQQQQDESMHGCTEDDLLLSQLDATTYRPGDYEKLKSIANEVVESYCNLEPVCNVSATTVMYTLDPTSGSLGTITLPADLGPVGTVTVVTAAQQEQLVQATSTAEITTVVPTSTNPIPIAPSRGASGGSKPPKKYSRKPKGGATGANANSNGSGSCGGNGNGSNGQQSGGNGGSPGSVPRKERSLHYCSICSKGFKDKYSVNVHIRTHTGEKPFACSLCGKNFRQKAHLAKHYQTHVAQKPNVGSAGSSASSNASPTTDVTTARSIAETAACNPSS